MSRNKKLHKYKNEANILMHSRNIPEIINTIEYYMYMHVLDMRIKYTCTLHNVIYLVYIVHVNVFFTCILIIT